MLSAQLFGGLAVRWQDKPLPVIPSRVARSLLAYLLVHPKQVHTRDLLIGTFWPDLPEDVARRRLSQALWQIRNSLDAVRPPAAPPLIVAESDTLHINPDVPLHIDVDDFQQHLSQTPGIPHDEAALALYIGEFLAGYYEDWAVAQREQLRLLFLEALARLVESYKGLGDYERALTCARRWVQEEPWHETAHREVMRLCHLLGCDAEALKQFAECRELLAEELGAEPAAETVALAQEIAQHAECGDVVDLPPALTAAAPMMLQGTQTPEGHLVGRADERAVLLTHIEALLQGLGGLVLVEGEAGVGKTRLLQTLARDAEWRGVEVLVGRSPEGARATPYALLVDALGTGLTTLRARQLLHLVDEIWLQVLRPLIPTLVALLPDLPAPPPLDPAQEQRRLALAISYLIGGWSQVVPLLLILEDLHWAGADTLTLLAHLVPALREHRVLIVGSYRGAEARAHPEIWAQIQTLDRAGVHARLILDGLDAEATGELIRRSLGLSSTAPLFEARLHRETQGNPLFIIETLRTLYAEGLLTQNAEGAWVTPWDARTTDYAELPVPPAVEQTITRRLALLSPAQRRAMHLAAVIGTRLDFDTLCAAGGEDTPPLLEAMRALVQRRFLDETDRDYSFSHDVVRQVAYATIDPDRRASLHRRVAQALEVCYPDRAAALAHHWTRARVWGPAAACHREAGDRARAVYANAEAVDHYTQALHALAQQPEESEQSCAALLAREAVHDLMGHREAQVRDLARLVTLAGAQDDAAFQAKVALRQAKYHHAIGDYAGALHAAQATVRRATAAQEPQLQAEGYRQWGRILWHQGHFDEARMQLDAALSLAHRHALRAVEARCLCDLGTIAGQQGEYDPAQAYLLDALHRCREIGDREGEGIALNNLGIVTRRRGDYDQARAYHEQSLRIRREIGDRRGESSVLNSLGIICRHQGDFVAAVHYFEQALAVMRSIGDLWFECRTLYNLGMCSINLGDDASAQAYLERSLRISQEVGDHGSEGVALEGLGMVCRHQGKHRAAREKLLQALDIIEGVGERDGEATILTDLGAVLTAMGALEEAAAAYRQALAIRQDLGLRYRSIDALAGLATIAMEQSELARAQEYVEETLALLAANAPIHTEDLFQVYLTCHRVLRANADPRAKRCLATAHVLLQAQAARIDDEALRRSFLQNVNSHREILAAYQARATRQRTLALPRADASQGRSLREDEYIDVTWTLETPDDAALPPGVTRRRHRLLRLLREAWDQGAIPRDADLAEVLGVSRSTVRRDVAALREEGHDLPPRRR